ncbi:MULTISPECIES: antitermination protein Q [unclassified Serratia (in: enterobacteria)]|uniref:antitermination protein Q n=1 Tax=unclassified Serratia (in: enterobacteria) TaxID=2647522 RepID=UPI0030763044
MKLEASLKHFSPQGLTITDTPNGTSADRLTGTDVMAALGVVQSKARFGMAAFLGKTGISDGDREQAIHALTQYAKQKAPKHVGKVAGRKMARCMVILATMAYEEYSHSAAGGRECQHCNGKGLLSVYRDVVKYPGYVGADGEKKIAPRIEKELVREYCQHCNGKGVIAKRCRNCKGTGKALDREATKSSGAPVIKDCERCNGKGFSRMPSSVAYRAIAALIPDLNERTWRRNWKPFYESLVSKCEVEEGAAVVEFSRVTR